MYVAALTVPHSTLSTWANWLRAAHTTRLLRGLAAPLSAWRYCCVSTLAIAGGALGSGPVRVVAWTASSRGCDRDRKELVLTAFQAGRPSTFTVHIGSPRDQRLRNAAGVRFYSLTTDHDFNRCSTCSQSRNKRCCLLRNRCWSN